MFDPTVVIVFSAQVCIMNHDRKIAIYIVETCNEFVERAKFKRERAVLISVLGPSFHFCDIDTQIVSLAVPLVEPSPTRTIKWTDSWNLSWTPAHAFDT